MSDHHIVNRARVAQEGVEMDLQPEKFAKVRQRFARDVIKVKPAARSRPAGTNRSVARALNLLLDVARSPKAQSFVDLQKRHKLPKATLHKLLATLEALDFLRRDTETGKYSIGLT